MDKWECTVCGYVYNPEIGDPTQGIPARTSFEQLPRMRSTQKPIHKTAKIEQAPESSF